MNISLVLLPETLKNNIPALGIAYLASSLKQNNHSINKLDFNLNLDEFLDKILKKDNNKNISTEFFLKLLSEVNSGGGNNLNRLLKNQNLFYNELNTIIKEYINFCIHKILETRPEIVGFSVFSRNKITSLLIAKELKKKSITVVFGGPETTFCKILPQFLDEGWLDYIVIGEGEEAFKKIAEINEQKEDIGNVLTRNNPYKEINNVFNKQDLDSMPYPYFDKEEIEKSDYKMLTISGTRGCKHNCKFCLHRKIWPNFYSRNPRNVVEEMKYQIKTTGVKNFRMNDSTINCDLTYLKELCKQILKENIRIKWGGNTRVDKNMTGEMFSLLYQSGCTYIKVGVESGSEKILKDMNKGAAPSQASEFIKKAHESGIWVHCFFIIGYPSEKHNDFLETIRFVNKNLDYIDSIIVYNYMNFPDSETAKSGIKSIPKNIVRKRKQLFDKIYQYKEEIPFQHLLNYNGINFKKTKINELKSEIKVNNKMLKKYLTEFK